MSVNMASYPRKVRVLSYDCQQENKLHLNCTNTTYQRSSDDRFLRLVYQVTRGLDKSGTAVHPTVPVNLC